MDMSIVFTERSLLFGIILIATVSSSLIYLRKQRQERIMFTGFLVLLRQQLPRLPSQSRITKNVIMDLLKKLASPLQQLQSCRYARLFIGQFMKLFQMQYRPFLHGRYIFYNRLCFSVLLCVSNISSVLQNILFEQKTYGTHYNC